MNHLFACAIASRWKCPLTLAVVAAGAAAQPASFQGIGSLPAQAHFSSAWAASDDGGVVAGWSIGNYQSLAIRWTAQGGLEPLGYLPPPAPQVCSEAYAISGDGQIVAGWALGATIPGVSNLRPFRWSRETGMVELRQGPTVYGGGAFGLTADGGIAVGYANGAKLWLMDGSFAPLASQYAWSISRDGARIAGHAGAAAFYLDRADGTVVRLDGLTGPGSPSADGIVSADGTVIVGHAPVPGGRRAFRWSAQTGTVALDDLPNGVLQCQAWDVSAGGLVIVGVARDASGDFPVVWDRARGIMRLRDLLEREHGLGDALRGWTLKQINGVSADGRTLVGDGIGPRGREGWVAHLGYACYADCDRSGARPVLDVRDFECFVTRFNRGDAYANCDRSTAPPVLNAADFVCFLGEFTRGCP